MIPEPKLVQTERGWGFGATIRQDGVLTVWHVVDGCSSLTIDRHKAEVLQVDKHRDLVLLKVRANGSQSLGRLVPNSPAETYDQQIYIGEYVMVPMGKKLMGLARINRFSKRMRSGTPVFQNGLLTGMVIGYDKDFYYGSSLEAVKDW